MKNVLILGGTGYIEVNFLKTNIELKSGIQYFVVSRSGNGNLKNKNITYIRANIDNLAELKKQLPQTIDYIFNFVGVLDKEEEKMRAINNQSVDVMIELAKDYSVEQVGYVAGKLGPKQFLKIKLELVRQIENSGINYVISNPTLVYGNGRKDSMTKAVPILKLIGIFNKNMKPIHVDEVVKELSVDL